MHLFKDLVIFLQRSPDLLKFLQEPECRSTLEWCGIIGMNMCYQWKYKRAGTEAEMWWKDTQRNPDAVGK